MNEETREERIARQAAEAAQRTEDDFIFAHFRLPSQRKLVNCVAEPKPARTPTKAEMEEGTRLDEKHRRLSTDGARADCRMLPLYQPCPPGCNCARQLAIVERDEAAASWSEQDTGLYRIAFREAPKDFERISGVVRQSFKDCQAFYYSTKASGLYKQICDVRYWSDLWDAADAAATARSNNSGEHPREDGSVFGNVFGNGSEEDEKNSDDSGMDPRSLEHRNTRTSGESVIAANGWTNGCTSGGFAPGGDDGSGASSAGKFFCAGPAGDSAFTRTVGGGAGGYFGGIGGGFSGDMAGFSASKGANSGEIMAMGSFVSEITATGGCSGGSSSGGSGSGSGSGGPGPPNKRLRAESLSHSLQMGPGAGAACTGAAAVGKRHKHSDWLSVNDRPTKQLRHTKHVAGSCGGAGHDGGGGRLGHGGDTLVPVPSPNIIPSMPSPELQRKLENLSLGSAFGDGSGGGSANGPDSDERIGCSSGGFGGASSRFSIQLLQKPEPQQQRSGWDVVVDSGELSLSPLSPHRNALPMGGCAWRHGGGGGDDDSNGGGDLSLNGSNDFYGNDSGGASVLTPLELGEGRCGSTIADGLIPPDDGWSNPFGRLVMADLEGDFAGGSIGCGSYGQPEMDPDRRDAAAAGGGSFGIGDRVMVQLEAVGLTLSRTASVVVDEEVDGL